MSSSSSSSSSFGAGAFSFFQRWGNSNSTNNGRPLPGNLRKESRSPATIDTNATPSPSSSSSSSSSSSELNNHNTKNSDIVEVSPYRSKQFDKLLSSDNVDLKALRKLAWNGVPWMYRTQVWQLLFGYMPTNRSRRITALTRKRKEYQESVANYFDNIADTERTAEETELLRQIIVDLHRTCPMMPFFHQAGVQKLMERILYIWSIRHPASGYVQGMNDLLTPLLLISLHPYVDPTNDNNNNNNSDNNSKIIDQTVVLRCDVAQISPQIMLDVEADAYWCLTKLLDDIQDHYTASQPGIQRMVLKLEDLMKRTNADLHAHLEEEGVNYVQFAFRWMNCLLLRELSMRATIRLWDTYIAEEVGGFESFHVYVCAALLQQYKPVLMDKSFQDLLLFLQDMPSTQWIEKDVELILSQAYILSSLYEGSPSHLN